MNMRRNTLLEWAAINSIAPKIGCTPETLKLLGSGRLKRSQGIRPGMTSAERDHMKELELREPKLAPCQRNHTQSSCFFRPSGARPLEEIVIFIDEHKTDYGALADLRKTSDRFVEYLRKKASSNEP